MHECAQEPLQPGVSVDEEERHEADDAGDSLRAQGVHRVHSHLGPDAVTNHHRAPAPAHVDVHALLLAQTFSSFPEIIHYVVQLLLQSEPTLDAKVVRGVSKISQDLYAGATVQQLPQTRGVRGIERRHAWIAGYDDNVQRSLRSPKVRDAMGKAWDGIGARGPG